MNIRLSTNASIVHSRVLDLKLDLTVAFDIVNETKHIQLLQAGPCLLGHVTSFLLWSDGRVVET